MFPTSPQLRELVERAREVTARVVKPNAEREDREALWPEASMRALAEAGLMGLHVPESLGGHGGGLQALAAIASVIARESPSTALCYAMHCVGTAVIAAKATDYQREEYLRPIARGEHITTLALSEPGTGSHFYIPETTLTPTPEGYAIDGTKSFVTNGHHADSYVISTVAPDAAAGDPGTFSCVILDASAQGMEWTDVWQGFGMRANSSRTVRLRDVRIPAGNLLGERGDQLWYIFEVVAPYFLMAMAGTYLGVAEECVEIARHHLGTRRFAHTGELLGSAPVAAFELGGLWTRLEMTRQLVHSAAERGDAGAADALTAVLACKLAASNAAVELANEAMTLTGGAAYRANSKLARMLRDARASHVMAPTSHIIQTWIGRALLGLPLL